MKLGQIWASKSKNVGWSTAASFKGLENHYIILIEAESDNLTDYTDQCFLLLLRGQKQNSFSLEIKTG